MESAKSKIEDIAKMSPKEILNLPRVKEAFFRFTTDKATADAHVARLVLRPRDSAPPGGRSIDDRFVTLARVTASSASFASLALGAPRPPGRSTITRSER